MFYCEELERETDCCDCVQSQIQTDPHGIFFLIHITSIINVRKKRREAKPWSGLPARYVHCCHKTAAKSSARVSETWR